MEKKIVATGNVCKVPLGSVSSEVTALMHCIDWDCGLWPTAIVFGIGL
jgi:hypothetical protein